MIQLAAPWVLLLLLLLPLFLEESWRRAVLEKAGLTRARLESPSLRFSTPVALESLPRSWRQRWRPAALTLLWCSAYTLCVVALARPQTRTEFAEVEASGRDIMLVLDTSGSMEALDFFIDGERVTRLEALKSVMSKFVDARKGDRVGLIVFGTDVYTQCPLTLDHAVLKEFIAELEVGMAGDGTALGDAVGIALKRIKGIEAESKVMVLVTDGLRTAGQLDPKEAAEIAARLGIKIYTIGIGGKAPAPFRRKDLFGYPIVQYSEVPLDEQTLKEIASRTGGRYFHAAQTEELAKVYKEIDRLEQRIEKTFEYVELEEHYAAFLLPGFLLLMLAELGEATVFRTNP